MASKTINIVQMLKYISSKDLFFENENLIFNNIKDSKKYLAESYSKKFSNLHFKDCKIFLNNFESLNNLINIKHSIKLENCVIFIDKTNYIYSLDETEILRNITENNSLNIIQFNVEFKYYPEDFERFTEIVKKFNIESLSFTFNYSEYSSSNNIPELHEFSNLLTGIYAKNILFKKNMIPFIDYIFLERCKGELFSMSKEIHIKSCEFTKLRFYTGTDLYYEDGSYATISCNGKFNVYFDSPIKYFRKNIEIVSGYIAKTNKKDLLERKTTVFKYHIFINQDFSDQNYITQYYHCKFFNCYFTSNQFLLDCEFNKCIFSEGTEYVKNS